MHYLTEDQHVTVLKRLLTLARKNQGFRIHDSGIEYTSLMICFLLHQISASESLLALLHHFRPEWFPTTVGYSIVRPMFEVDVSAHYISQSPVERAELYIKFGRILKYNEMQAVKKHLNSPKASWKEGLEMLWQHVYAQNVEEIVRGYDHAISQFRSTSSKGHIKPFHNWSGLSLKEMARLVDHEDAYDVFYADLSSYTHADIHLADRFLKSHGQSPNWSMRSNEGDLGFVVRYAVSFFECFLTLFGQQLRSWQESDVESCWTFDNS